jgi:hypothetical protein
MPYMVAFTDEMDKPLFLRHNGASFAALEYAFGLDHMFWYRASTSNGRYSIVGTTVKSPEHLPEKHTWRRGQRAYVATTVASGCILGAEVSTSASATALTKSYGVFADEARDVDPTYAPKTVCLDSWKPARQAWKKLFSAVSVVLCFLHSILKVKRSRPTGVMRERLIGRSWHVYAASTKAQFSQRLRRLREWADAKLPEGSLLDAVHAMSAKCNWFTQAYDFDDAHRTTNHVDRLMDHQDRRFYAMHYFHGTLTAASLAARSGALYWNFHPYGRRARPQAKWTCSPFTELNGFAYLHPRDNAVRALRRQALGTASGLDCCDEPAATTKSVRTRDKLVVTNLATTPKRAA